MSKTQKFDHCQQLAWMIQDCQDPDTKKSLVRAWALSMKDFLNTKDL